MTVTEFQPTIPTPAAGPNDAEIDFIQDSPAEFFPDNPESNFGLKRWLWCEQTQDVIDQQDLTYNERFPQTSTVFLDQWEIMLGTPVHVAGSEENLHRQNQVLLRMRRGPFTEQLILDTIGSFLASTFGGVPQLTPEGIAIPSAGIPLYSEGGDVTSMYRVYQHPEDFSYEVWIRNDVTPDLAALNRELSRITPAGIRYTVDNSRANILDYDREIRETGPTAYWKLGTNANDANTLNDHGTQSGGVTFGATALAQNASTAAATFDGTDDHITVPMPTSGWSKSVITSGAWVKPTGRNDAVRSIFHLPGGIWSLINASNLPEFRVWNATAGAWVAAVPPASEAISLNQTAHLVGTYDGVTIRLYKNGNLIASAAGPGVISPTAGQQAYIGAESGTTNRFAGVIDEVVLFNQTVPAERIKRHYNVGTNNPAP